MSTITIITLESNRSSYGPKEVLDKTMTIGELIDYLSNYDRHTKIIISNDNGYTYGEIKEEDFREKEVEGKTYTVTDIKWDIDKNDFDNIEEFEEEESSLPDTVELPYGIDEDEIEDYLHDEYYYYPINYSIEEN